MQAETRENEKIKQSWSVIHPLSREDSGVMTTLRSAVAAMKGKLEGVAARGPFNGIMEHGTSPDGVSFEPDTVGGISGWWAKPVRARKGAAILHLHGGWFNWGTASAFRNFVGHIANSAGADAFIHDYRLAPEHPFPAAVKDAEACYRGLVDRGINKIALTGDSAGGNLALVLLSVATAQAGSAGITPVGAVALSPVTDLALTGESFESRAEADPYLSSLKSPGSCAHIWARALRRILWPRRFMGICRGCPQSASTWEMMKCCWMTRAAMWSAPLRQASTPSSTYGWECHTGL